jgi:Ca2+-binding EF-hand superfamily protein
MNKIFNFDLRLNDLNGDGEIEFKEFILFYTMLHRKRNDEERKAHYSRVFDLLDEDSDGLISQQEFLNYVEGVLDMRDMKDVIPALFQKYNTNHDKRNSSQLLSRDDFINLCFMEKVFN